MCSTKSLGLALLLGYVFILISRTSCQLEPNATDCREMEDLCSDYVLVGECNQTNGECTCDTYNITRDIDCFYYDAPDNFCRVRDCWHFSNSSGECSEGPRERIVALLLSIFLINFGAANFYIERFDLAVPQIILGLMLCFFQFGSCAVASRRDDDTSKICIFCCSVNSFLSILFFSWWLADLIIFAMNSRDDGDGCPLIT